jgi:hypothetical protein
MFEDDKRGNQKYKGEGEALSWSTDENTNNGPQYRLLYFSIFFQ